MARDANWIDGLRGVASFMVVGGHLCTAFVPWIHAPADGPESAPRLFQLPVFRLAVGGRAAVALFFLITGYVNSIGPIGRSLVGDTDAAFNGIARSALARSGRLVLPTMIATLITWFLANINVYHMTEHVDSTWIRQGWHGQEPTVWASLRSLLRAEVQTWTIGWNEYDGTQWTLHLFLEGSMLVYMTMFATVLIKPKARCLVYAVLYMYFWQLGDGYAIGALKGLNIVFGMIVAELHQHFKDRATSFLPAPIPALLIASGMFMAGYPQESTENARWSCFMHKSMAAITVEDSDVRRYWDHLGASAILLGIFFSQNARNVLTSPPFNFLGRVSFPVYLLQNTFIKTFLTWMVYLPSAMNPSLDEHGDSMDLERGTTLHIFIAVAVFYYLLYRSAALWVQYIDPFCARLVNAVIGWANGAQQLAENQPILQITGDSDEPKEIIPT